AQASTVIHVVRAEGGADQLLEEIVILVGALGAPETGQRARTVLPLDLGEAPRHQVERLIPGRLAERLNARRVQVRLAFPPAAGAHAAVRAHPIDLLHGRRVESNDERLVGQRAGGAGRHAFAAGDTGRLAHRPVVVKDDVRAIPLPAAPDHFVYLHGITRPDA